MCGIPPQGCRLKGLGRFQMKFLPERRPPCVRARSAVNPNEMIEKTGLASLKTAIVRGEQSARRPSPTSNRYYRQIPYSTLHAPYINCCRVLVRPRGQARKLVLQDRSLSGRIGRSARWTEQMVRVATSFCCLFRTVLVPLSS